jgi:4-amino-4-deoxy-L-arabinose transferase-like glycosyltransferase
VPALIGHWRARLRSGDRSALLLAILAAALVLRIVVVVATPHFVPATDAAEYDQAAVSLARHGSFAPSVATFHGGPTAYHPPLFSIVLAAVYKVVGTGSEHVRWTSGRLLEALLGTLTVWLVALIAFRIWPGRRVGLTAAAIAAIYPPLMLVGSSLLSESLFIPLVLAAVWAALVYRDDRRLRWAVLAGVLVGLSALTRGNGFLLVIPVGFLVWTGRRRRSWGAPLAVLLAAVVVLIPWTVRNYNVFHTFVPVTTETGYAIAGTYNAQVQHQRRNPALWSAPFAGTATILRSDPTANEQQISSRLETMGLDYIRAHPSSLLKTVFWNTVRMVWPSPGLERYLAPYEGYPARLAQLSAYGFWLLLVLAVIGAAVPLTRRAPWALWMCPLLVYLTTVGLEGTTRYRSPADPFLILPAAIGVLALVDRARAWRHDRVALGVPA